MATSFKQFSFCKICKVSHKHAKRKHVYSQRHQILLNNLLEKCKKKVEGAKSQLDCAIVHSAGWEASATVWCHFCQCESLKHEVRSDCVVVNAGFLRHLALKLHHEKVHMFLWENFFPMSRIEEFLIHNSEIDCFSEKADRAVVNFLADEKEKICQEANKIHIVELQRVAFYKSEVAGKLSSCPNKDNLQDDRRNCLQPHPPSNSLKTSLGKQTLSAFGPGLTCISAVQPEDDPLEGNIYSGALPPWLTEDNSSSSRKMEPSLKTYKKHLHDLDKQKLPRNRVGATFTHFLESGSEWLPPFGRIWHNGCRSDSQKQFLKGQPGQLKTREDGHCTDPLSMDLMYPDSTRREVSALSTFIERIDPRKMEKSGAVLLTKNIGGENLDEHSLFHNRPYQRLRTSQEKNRSINYIAISASVIDCARS